MPIFPICTIFALPHHGWRQPGIAARHNTLMSRIGLIISTEYRSRVKKKSFILTTFLTPVLFACLIMLPVWLASIGSNEEKRVAIVDNTGLYASLFAALETDDNMVIEVAGRPVEELKDDEARDYTAIVLISADLAQNPDAVTIYSHTQVPREVTRLVESTLSDYVERKKLESYNIAGLQQMIADAHTEIHASTVKWNDAGEETSSNTDIAIAVGMISTLVIYMFIFVSGGQVMSSVVQEKANRIVEVMVCSVKPWELMWGKIISVALVCLTQIVLWFLLTGLLTGIIGGVAGIGMASAQTGDPARMMEAAAGTSPAELGALGEVLHSLASINWVQLILLFVVYFIGGYLLYASLFAAIGAAVDSEADTQQFMTPITIIVIFALYAGIYSAENPDGPLALWCSMIPFTSPIVMMVRLPFDVPGWQIAASLALLALTIVGTTWIGSKIYRVGILMYGKKPSWKEMVKWLKYK